MKNTPTPPTTSQVATALRFAGWEDLDLRDPADEAFVVRVREAIDHSVDAVAGAIMGGSTPEEAHATARDILAALEATAAEDDDDDADDDPCPECGGPQTLVIHDGRPEGHCAVCAEVAR